MTESELGVVDRATLRAWRIGNVVGWSLIAVAGGAFVRAGLEALADTWYLGLNMRSGAASFAGYAAFVGAPAAIVTGLLMGSIIGARVRWRPILVSAGVSLLFLAVFVTQWFLVLVPEPAERLIVLGTALLQVPATILAARSAAQSRPEALRIR